MNLSGKRTVVWITPPDDGVMEVEEYRFTFVTCSMEGSGRFYKAMRDFEAWYEQAYGITIEAARSSKVEGERVEAWRAWHNGNNYAAVLASLKDVESRRRSLETGEASEWQREAVPLEWESYQGFYEGVPWSTIIALSDAAHGANPGLWRVDTTDLAKKNGNSSEPLSRKSPAPS